MSNTNSYRHLQHNLPLVILGSSYPALHFLLLPPDVAPSTWEERLAIKQHKMQMMYIFLINTARNLNQSKKALGKETHSVKQV